MARQNSHTHRYVKRPLGKNKVWSCALPGCTHYIPKHLQSTKDAVSSVCNSCGEDYILSLDSQEENPRCEDCKAGILKGEAVAPITDVLKNYLDSKV